MMAPNSPRLAAKAVITPATIPGKASGRADIDETVEPAAPSVSRRLVQALVGAFQREADGPHLEGKGDDAPTPAPRRSS